MDRACSMYGGEVHTEFWWGKQEKDTQALMGE
jgi:hypothetical protein